jgi:hypothetical protein
MNQQNRNRLNFIFTMLLVAGSSVAFGLFITALLIMAGIL